MAQRNIGFLQFELAYNPVIDVQYAISEYITQELVTPLPPITRELGIAILM